MSSAHYTAPELQKLTQALHALGATQNAILLYVTSFRNGRMTVGKLASLCGMDRSSAYLACDQLCALGVFEQDQKQARKIVWARPPQAVLARLRTKVRGLRRQHEELVELLPQLTAAYVERESRPVLQFFSGHEGLRKISDDVLEHAQSEILLYTNQRVEGSVFTDRDHHDFVEARLARNLSIRVLAADTPEAHVLQRSDAKVKRATRIVNGEPFVSETYIYGDNVAMLSFDSEVIGFIVRSKEFAQHQRWLFEELWRKHGSQDSRLRSAS